MNSSVFSLARYRREATSLGRTLIRKTSQYSFIKAYVNSYQADFLKQILWLIIIKIKKSRMNIRTSVFIITQFARYSRINKKNISE